MFALILCLVCSQAPSPQEALRDLIRQARQVPQVTITRGHGIGKEQQALARKFQEYGALAIPDLLPLLEDPDEIVREFIGYVLREIKGLEERHLDTLIRAHRAGNGWIAPAIAHVGTPRALEFLVAELQAPSGNSTQVTWALSRMGETAAIALADSFRGDSPLGEGYGSCVGVVLEQLGVRAAPARERLLEVALGAGFRSENRRLAVEAMGGLGSLAQGVVPQLKDLAMAEPELFGESVQRAILDIGGPEAAAILVKQLDGEWETCTLRDLAALGEHGFEAGPAVLERLAAPNRDVRVAAARTLGYVGYYHAIEPLVRETMQSEDWKLALAAVESLGRLRTNRALPALQSVAASYWYPPVRDAAKQALAVIHGTADYVSRFHPRNFAFEFSGYAERERGTDAHSTLPPYSAGPDELTAPELVRNTYTLEHAGADPNDAPIEPRRQTPGCGLRVANGMLLGDTRGEWGGELVFRKQGSEQETVLHENVHSIHRTQAGIVVVAGLAHMAHDDGALYRIDPTPGGSYTATWWKRLPGEPQVSRRLADGSLFVRCRGGDVLLTTAGQLEMAGAR